MKSHARVVIVGGGVMGVGLLYHLALEGWRDIVLVEKGELTSGSTWHAAGQCPLFNGSLNVTKVHRYGIELYPKLAQLTGHQVSWHGCGGLRLAVTDEEVRWLKHVYGISKLAGYEAHIIGPAEIPTHHPYLETFGIKAAFLTVTDGHVAPADITNAMAAAARQLGAEICRRTRVTDIKHRSSGEWEVVTEQGSILCEHVVNSAGSYCDVVGSWTGLNVPIANMLHHYVITEPLQELIDLPKELPVVRDPYVHAYLREETHGVLVGPYETATAHVCWGGAPPAWDFESELIAPELERLMPWLEKATERLPLFGKAGMKSVISGAITHTPDGVYLSGPAPGTPNYWMHCGASIGVAQGAGAGKFLAQWMVHGQAEINMREFDPRRFGNWATKEYATQTAIEDYQHMYYCYPPGEQQEVGRGLRKSTLYSRLAAQGAQFAQVFGWERPRWYSPTGSAERFSWTRSNWWEPVREEALAVRQRVGLMDLSTFAKFELTGPDALAFLQRICANKIPDRDGRIVLTHLLTPAGFVESEMTITRLAADHFYVLCAAVAQLHDRDQLEWRKQPSERVSIADVTDDYGVLVLAGPKAREVLSKVTPLDLSNATFRWLTGKEESAAGVTGVRLLRVSYVGELGWELHVPMARMPTVYDGLMSAGKSHGMRLFGTYAMNSLRMEKAYRAWGSELTNEVTLIEAGMERFVDFTKEFIGKSGSAKSLREGPRALLAYLEVDTGQEDCLGNEPVYRAEALVGITTGGAYGFAVERSLAFAYLEPKLARVGTELEIMVRGEMRRARVIAQPIWDPANERLRA
ncbi:MAG TPA: FAD-dependent oxidoreductase [Steroidobacteraceae bacterium]|nr:FAD-dependent oxidoreductase [Steroidobacteraceae bacterium]